PVLAGVWTGMGASWGTGCLDDALVHLSIHGVPGFLGTAYIRSSRNGFAAPGCGLAYENRVDSVSVWAYCAGAVGGIRTIRAVVLPDLPRCCGSNHRSRSGADSSGRAPRVAHLASLGKP